MSREQANSFKKHRDAEDPTGNLTWIVRLQNKALRAGPEALARLDVEAEFELSNEEKIMWRLMKLPRKVIDLEHVGVLPSDKLRGFLRGLVAADVVDIVDPTEAKALIPAELKRIKAEVTGAPLPKKNEPMKGRVFRPDITKPGEGPAPVPEAVAMPAAEPVMRAPPTTAPGTPRTYTGEEQMLKDALERAFSDMGKQNHYEFLGLQRPTDDVAVRQAYVRLAREYHPDRLAGSGLSGDAAFAKKVDALFKHLNDAQAAVATAELRAGYDRTVESLGHTPAQDVNGQKMRRPAEAQNAFRMAETFFKKKDIAQAEMHYRQAVMFDPEDPKILTGLAWCVFSNPAHEEGPRGIEAKKKLLEVTQRFKHADAHYKLGLVLRKGGDEGAAQRQFSAAAKLDPQHTDAQREVRLLEMRDKKVQEDKAAEKSLFGKFLRK